MRNGLEVPDSANSIEQHQKLYFKNGVQAKDRSDENEQEGSCQDVWEVIQSIIAFWINIGVKLSNQLILPWLR